MLLAIDIGNTNTVLGVFDGDEAGRLVADQDRRAHHGRRARAHLPRPARGPRDHRHRRLLDRARRHARAADDAGRRYYPTCPPCSSSRACARASASAVENPKEVGTDRIVQHAAAFHLVRRPVHRRRLRHVHELRRRQREGRVPRRRAGARASRSRWTRWPRAPPSCARSSWSRRARPIGKNTVESLQSGILYGFAGQVDGMVRAAARRAGAGRPRRCRGDRDRRPGHPGRSTRARPSPATSPI